MDAALQSTSQKRKHITLALTDKIKIIEEVETTGTSAEIIGRKYGVGASSIRRFVKNKEVIRKKAQEFCEHGVVNRKTVKGQQFPLLEEALFIWILQQRESNIIVPLDVLKAKAESYFRNFQEQGYYENGNFAFSDGWVARFKSRYGLKMLKVAGEKASADRDAYLKFKSILMQKIVDMNLTKAQVFNADESALFTKMMASRTIALWDETVASGRKLNKTRFTFMPCCNIDGSLKLKLMFIGTANNPRDLPKGDKSSLPVSYYSSKNAWMTRKLFRDWFYMEFIPAVRNFCSENNLEEKALLLLDNCTAHYDGCDDLVSDDGKIQVIYLPPNVTSECQPMDQSVINSIKIRYKRKLMLKLLLENENLAFEERLKKISLRESIDWVASAWDEISSLTIENSWKKLIDEFPGCEWNNFEELEDSLGDVKSLVASIDSIAGTKTTDQQIGIWLRDQVLDADGNTVNITSQVYTDKEILDSLINKPHDSSCGEEEWLDSSEDNTIYNSSNAAENVSSDDTFETNEVNFAVAIKSLDNVISFVRNDPLEVGKLKLLRNKLLENEWKKHNI